VHRQQGDWHIIYGKIDPTSLTLNVIESFFRVNLMNVTELCFLLHKLLAASTMTNRMAD
jgi:hypothetical protein